MTEPPYANLGKLSADAFDIFQCFPLPLALMEANGSATVNRLFDLQLDKKTSSWRRCAPWPAIPAHPERSCG